jgi:hypothetical protein
MTDPFPPTPPRAPAGPARRGDRAESYDSLMTPRTTLTSRKTTAWPVPPADLDEVVCIKYLPRDLLLHELWLGAMMCQNLARCTQLAPNLTLAQVKKDIRFMGRDKRELSLTTYWGRSLFVKLSGNYLDTFTYDMMNGPGRGRAVIDRLKRQELGRMVVRFYTHF